ncbi:MFS transporter [Catellatospora sp. KI3]|uniref:MFS transporter n=1 Tax=Catellatospora sp. KI3 TaxID=3041620 RepID=UPI002482A394|nr:MFS transporter [Catellatospora sp. KI3]MDI1463593.1 MFS transporter [Catellatospora sp. KI3]
MTLAIPELRQRPSWLPPLLRQTPFRRYWTGQSVSLLGDQISELAVPLFAVLVAGAGPAEMGYLTAAALLPNLLFSLLLGAWADRRPDKRRLMIVADLGRAAVLLLAPALYLLDALTMPVLYAVAFSVGTFSVLFEVCRTTLFVSLVPREQYVAASALLNGARAFSFAAGSSVAGVLVKVLSAPGALVLDAVSYLFSAATLARVRPAEPAPSGTPGLGLRRGLAALFSIPVLRACVLGATTLNLFNYMYSALVILYVTRDLGVPPELLGLGLGLAAGGALLGAALAGRLAARFGVGPMYVVGYVLFPAPLMLIPLADGPRPVVLAMLFAAEFLSGIGLMILDTAGGALQAGAVPDDLRARVGGAQRTLNYGIRPLGAVLGGVLGAHLGVRPTLWLATVGALGGVLWLLASPIPRMRTP